MLGVYLCSLCSSFKLRYAARHRASPSVVQGCVSFLCGVMHFPKSINPKTPNHKPLQFCVTLLLEASVPNTVLAGCFVPESELRKQGPQEIGLVYISAPKRLHIHYL